ncbi:hypothetical protein ACFQ1S_11240 [Kibdelosporangium lantanae]|uniref:Uncharacterized protein n=1 Tax=Kibdelosporangium lantanae TaxID=1497396 RepID=A0ABW3M634_9PSEU
MDAEALAKFTEAVEAAVTRAHRAAAEAREQSTRLLAELNPQPEVPPSGDDDEDFSQEQILTDH